MKMSQILKDLFDELDKEELESFSGLPNFVTTSNGELRYFTPDAQKHLLKLTRGLHANRGRDAIRIELNAYARIVRQGVADIHAAKGKEAPSRPDEESLIQKLRIVTENKVTTTVVDCTHHFPAWTMGIESKIKFSMGPVVFRTTLDWLDSVNFHPELIAKYNKSPEVNSRWKEDVKLALTSHETPTPPGGLAAIIYNSIKDCPSIVSVTIRGYERNVSRKLARLICKNALDAASLGLGGKPELFLSQTLKGERLPPLFTDTIVEEECLLLPGYNVGPQGMKYTSLHKCAESAEVVQKNVDLFSGFSSILDGLLFPAAHKCPNLVNRWANALDWFGEGNREINDSVAIVKLATCLDILSCGGKNEGIRKMVCNLFNWDKEKIILVTPVQKSVAQLVKDIYDYGRSKTLHGNHVDRLEELSENRALAAWLARIVLIQSVLLLKDYSGEDCDNAFRESMFDLT